MTLECYLFQEFLFSYLEYIMAFVLLAILTEVTISGTQY